MKGKILALFLGFAVALSLVASAQRTGGFPSRPRFQAVTLGAGTLAGTGDVRINAGSLGIGAAPATANGTIAAESASYNDTTAPAYRATFTAGASMIATPRAGDVQIGATTSHPLLFITNSAARLTIGSTGQISLNSDTVGGTLVVSSNNANGPYMSFSRSGTPFGDIGNGPQIGGGGALDDFAIGTRGTGDFVIATGSTATERFRITDTGATTLNGGTVWTSANDGAGSGLDADTLDGISSAGFLQSARDIVTQAAISGASMAVGDTITISKAAATSRASTIADTNDPDLQITALPAGHYIVDFQVDFNQGGGGVRYRLEAPSANSGLYGVQNCASTVTATNGAFDGLVLCAGTLRANGSGASAKAQASGTIAISWAQNTSNAANTTLEADSYLRVKRIN